MMMDKVIGVGNRLVVSSSRIKGMTRTLGWITTWALRFGQELLVAETPTY